MVLTVRQRRPILEVQLESEADHGKDLFVSSMRSVSVQLLSEDVYAGTGWIFGCQWVKAVVCCGRRGHARRRAFDLIHC